MKEFLQGKIVLNFNNFKDLEQIVLEKEKSLKTKQAEFAKEISATLDEKDIDEKVKFYQDYYIDFTLLVSDLRYISTKLFIMIDLYNEMGYDGLPKNIVEHYNSQRNFAPKEIFVIKNGNVMEKEDGLLEKERQHFINSDFFKSLMKNN